MNDLLSVTRAPESPALPDLAMLRLLQLASPALPIGAFAYSQGLEQATLLGWVNDEDTAAEWIAGLVTEVLPRLDLPVLAEAYAAAQIPPGMAHIEKLRRAFVAGDVIPHEELRAVAA